MGIVETCRDLDQWLPALGPVGSDDGSMDEARWATILADTAFVDETGEKPNAEVLDNIRHRLLVFGGRYFPPDVPWVEKWIHFPESGSWPVPAVLEVWLLDEGEDLDLYDLMIRPRQVEDPTVEWVDVGLDVISLATMGTGKFLATGFKVGSRTVGGTLKAAQQETRMATSIEHGRRAAAAARGSGRQEIAEIRATLRGRSLKIPENRVGLSRIENIERSLDRVAARARSQARASYEELPLPEVTLTERFVLGGGDQASAVYVKDARRCMDMFPDSRKVQQAGQAALDAGNRARSVFVTGAAVDGSGASLDAAERFVPVLKRQHERLDRYFTWQVGSTW
jgi:hypothetical protein